MAQLEENWRSTRIQSYVEVPSKIPTIIIDKKDLQDAVTESMALAFQNQMIPLIQEHLGKIGDVLDNRFKDNNKRSRDDDEVMEQPTKRQQLERLTPFFTFPIASEIRNYFQGATI